MAAGENGLALVFGSTSQTLWPFTLGDVFLSNQSIVITKQEFISVLVGSVVIVALLFVWRRTTLGIALRALLESRRNLMLRGYNVNLLEKMISSIGFLFVGVAGLLWAVDSRVRPSMALEASLIGVVTFIVGSILAEGLWGLLFASLAIAVAKLLFSLFLEGDWGMTVPLFVFLAALLVYRGKLVLRVG
jgi:branched-chain amino acid transport system permease protein